MIKKLSLPLIAVILVVACCFSFAACNDDAESERATIVYIGDSIAEALIGPSPVSERDNYGYYALIGKANGFKYYNHAVSGHKTSGGALGGGKDGLLEMLMRDEENGTLMKSHLMQADIIQISVLGNNLLQYNLGLLLLEVADPDFDEKFKQGEGTTLLDLLYKGTPYSYDVDGEVIKDGNGDPVLPEEATRPSVEYPGSTVKFDFPPTYQNVCDIMARLRELNPNAQILFSTVYNPVYENCSHIRPAVKAKLAEIVDTEGRFGEAGKPITEVSQYRAVADKLLGVLNGIIDLYMQEHPDDRVYKLDIHKAFADITNSDVDSNGKADLSEDGLGRSLIYIDWTHPSNFGHAVIACEMQKALEELGYASKGALDGYKAIRDEQLVRMFADVDGFELQKARDAVKNAASFLDVTYAYFDAIKGYTPINY